MSHTPPGRIQWTKFSPSTFLQSNSNNFQHAETSPPSLMVLVLVALASFTSSALLLPPLPFIIAHSSVESSDPTDNSNPPIDSKSFIMPQQYIHPTRTLLSTILLSYTNVVAQPEPCEDGFVVLAGCEDVLC